MFDEYSLSNLKLHFLPDKATKLDMFTVPISIMNLNLSEISPVCKGCLYGIGGGYAWIYWTNMVMVQSRRLMMSYWTSILFYELHEFLEKHLLRIRCWFFVLTLRCQIAVHQECYGARNVTDFTSWVCRACETPNIERECCLCPVKGMDHMACFPIKSLY